MENSVLPLVWLLVCVVIIMGLAYLFTRYVVGRNVAGGLMRQQRGMMNILAQQPLGRDRQIVLVQVGDRFFLLGNTASQITTLAELSPEEMAAWREKERQTEEDGKGMSFAKSLQEVLKQRGGR